MIDINELREAIQTFGSQAINEDDLNELIDRLEAAEKERDELRNEIACVKEVEFPRKVQAVADAWKGKCERLEAQCDAAEAEALEQARLNGMGAERELALMAKLEAAEKEIAAMKQQEPVAWLHETRRDSDVVTDAVKHVWGKAAVGSMAAYSIPLYALPGAKGDEK